MKMHRLFAGMAAAVLAAGMMALPASASEAPQQFNYTAVTGGTAQYSKYLVMDSDAVCPAVSFSYSIAVGAAAKATDSDHIDVYAGIGTPTVGTATFAQGAATTAGAEGDGITGASGAGSADEKYATSTFTVDFSSVSFPEPGVYRYVITETTPTGAFSARSTPLARTLDVYVKDVLDGTTHKLAVDSYVMYDKVIDTAFAKTNTISAEADPNTTTYTVSTTGNKTTAYVNDYSTVDLGFSKAVDGNQASRDKFFKFTVTITNAPGAAVTVGGNYTAAPTKNSATEYTTAVMTAANTITDAVADVDGLQLAADSNGTITHDFYLQNGQSITLTGLPKGASYTITEDKEDYVPSVALTGDIKTGDAADEGTAIATNSATITDTYLKEDTTAAFTNTRQGTIPTGVVIPTAVPVAAGAALLGGVIVITVKRNRRKTEE